MLIVGLDLAGVESQPTGFCILPDMRAETCLVYGDDDILKNIRTTIPRMVAIDAPLSLPAGRQSIEQRTKVHLRECDKELLRRGIRFFPVTLGPMRKLTSRGIRLRKILEKDGFRVIEVYPGGAQDVLGIPRKQRGLDKLRVGLERMGVKGLNEGMSDHELDAVTCAFVAKLFLQGKAEVYGTTEQAIVMPKTQKPKEKKPTPRLEVERKQRMSKFDTETKMIVEALGLKWTPIGARFSSNPDEAGDSSRKLAICDAFDVVRRENIVLRLSKDNCSCPGGRHSAGFELLPLESIATTLTNPKHRIYRSRDAALASVRKQPQPVNRGDYLTLGPLNKFTADPDLVLFFVNPAQADRILGLVSFDGAEPFMYYPASSICCTVTNALAKAKPEMNLVSHFERKRHGACWSSDELLLALPLKDFETAVKDIPESGFGTATTS